MRKLFGWIFIVQISLTGYSQNINKILTDLKSIQIKEGSNRGLFPSFRQYQLRKNILKDDDNIFFTALIAWTLRNNIDVLDSASRLTAQSIIDEATRVYPAFKNAKGRPTYNYWKTKPPEVFPNGGLINLFNKQQALPDDLDCTAITMMALAAPQNTVDTVHWLMQDFLNEGGRAKAMLKEYKFFKTYSTWFGRKMPVDLDVCVLSNILVMVNKYRLEYTVADSAAMDFVRQVVSRRDYLQNADLISGYYQRSPVLLYHISRLMESRPDAELEKHRDQLIADAVSLYQGSGSFMDKILLSTSLMRWGAIPPVDTLVTSGSLDDIITNDDFVFFIANMGVVLGYPYNKLLSRSGFGRFNYYCPAYNCVLFLENALMHKSVHPG